MIEQHKSEIIDILQRAGEPVDVEDSFSFCPLGEGMGYSSFLWTMHLGGRKYAVKITDPHLRAVEMSEMAEQSEEERGSVSALFTQLHNRELQVYEWFQKFLNDEVTASHSSDLNSTVRFYGGTKCEDLKAGIIIMDDISSDSLPAIRAGLPLSTILSVINEVAAYQSAYLSTEEQIEFLPKDLLFDITSSSVLHCIEAMSEREWLTVKWKSALTEWADAEQLRAVQYQREEGDLFHTLCHMDLWTNNLIFCQGEKDQLELLAIVDWQAATVGNPLLDVASVIAFNMTPSERRLHESTILQYYVDGIRRRSHRFKKEFPIGTVEKLQPSYRRALRFAALQLVMQLGYRPEERDQRSTEDVVDESSEDDNNSEKLGIYTQRLRAVLEDIVE